MNSYYTKEEKSAYERSRRTRNMEQARDFRLIKSWMEKLHPNILNAYTSFKEGLQKQNPGRVDLAKSPMFCKFLRDPVQIPSEEKTDRYGASNSPHMETQVTLTSGAQDHARREVPVMGEKRRATSINSDEKEAKRRRTTSISGDGSEKSKDEDNTVNKGTEQGTRTKIEADIISMMDLMSSQTFRKVGHKDS